MKRMRGRTYKHHLASALVLHASPNSACRELFVEVLGGFYPENQVERVGRVESNIQQYYFDKRLLICDQLNYEDEKYKPVLERALKYTSFRRSIRFEGYEPDKQAGTKARGRPKKNDYCLDDTPFISSNATWRCFLCALPYSFLCTITPNTISHYCNISHHIRMENTLLNLES